MTLTTHALKNVFAVMQPDMRVTSISVTPSLYQELDQKFSGFKSHVLVSMHDFTCDWTTWERHPAGDEIVMLLEGEAALVLRAESGDETAVLAEAGSYIIVPANTWHTAKVSKCARMLFMTPGEGTENAESPEAG